MPRPTAFGKLPAATGSLNRAPELTIVLAAHRTCLHERRTVGLLAKGVERADCAGVGEGWTQAVHVDAVTVSGSAPSPMSWPLPVIVPWLMTVTNFVGVEAVNVDARAAPCRPESLAPALLVTPIVKLTVASTAPPVIPRRPPSISLPVSLVTCTPLLFCSAVDTVAAATGGGLWI